ncbi:MAG: hypothetical protein BM565_09400 [Gammaproteobacteria bacterium MedPE]|nr:MAG: hypothetical protein BM565_09400 [Gammaproteobacteria bacterium MedPE]
MLMGCNDSSLDDKLTRIIKEQGLSGNPIRDVNQQVRTIDSLPARLGKLLFFSTQLSGQRDVACASCHHPLLGGDDDLSLSVGVNPVDIEVIGHHRRSKSATILVPRNAPTTFNSSLWQRKLFHDGRIERLNEFSLLPPEISTPDEKFGDIDIGATSLVQAQAGFPVTSEHEMRAAYKDKSSNDSLRSALVDNLVKSVTKLSSDNVNSWQNLFLEVFPHSKNESLFELFNFQRIQFLIGEYEKSQVFIDTPWKAYVGGNKNALTSDEKRGAILFYTPVKNGGAGCVGCHSGDFFTDENFHVVAFPQIGEGVDIQGNDTGRYLRSGIPDDRYAFRTPSLINATATAPYGHNGAFDDLKNAIQYHLDPIKGSKKYDYSLKQLRQQGITNINAKKHTSSAVKQLIMLQRQQRSKLVVTTLSEKEIIELISFIGSLTDPCIKNAICLSPWLPNATEHPDNSILN